MSRPFQASKPSARKCLSAAKAAADPAGLQTSAGAVGRRNKALLKGTAAPETAVATLNAIKMFEPRQLKADGVGAEQIVAVLEEAIAKLEMSSLIPRVITSLDRFAAVLGPEITNKLREHQKLSDEMQHLLSGLEGGDAVRAEERRGCLRSLEQRLKRSARDVLRLLLAKPQLCQDLKHGAWERGAAAEEFIRAFGEFRDFMLERLRTSAAAEEEKSQFMEKSPLRVKENSEAITALEEELAAAIQAREQEIRKKDNMIKELLSSIQGLTKDHEAGIQKLKEEAEKRRAEELQASQARCAVLQQDMKELRAQLKALVLEHRTSELALRKRKYRLEREIVNWMQKYDADMAEKQAEYEEVNAAYAEEKAQLSLLMEKHAVLLQEYSQIEEQRRIREEKEEQAVKELLTRNLAATRIQAFWRGYLVRSLFESKRKKGQDKEKAQDKEKGQDKGKDKGKDKSKDKGKDKGNSKDKGKEKSKSKDKNKGDDKGKGKSKKAKK